MVAARKSIESPILNDSPIKSSSVFQKMWYLSQSFLLKKLKSNSVREAHKSDWINVFEIGSLYFILNNILEYFTFKQLTLIWY